MDILKALARLGVGVLSAGLLVLGLVAMSLVRAFDSGMIAIKPELFMQLAATAIGIVAIWKVMAGEFKTAGKVSLVALTALLLANVPLKLPGTWSLGAAAISERDRSNQRKADAMKVAHAVPCESPTFKADGSARYWWSPADEPPVCYDRPGVHPTNGTALFPVESAEHFAMIVRMQTARHNPPAPAPQPVAQQVLPPPPPAPEVQPQPPQRISAARPPVNESVNPQSLIDWHNKSR